MNNRKTSIKDELIKVMASIEITSYDHAAECENEKNSVGEIAYKRFIYLLEAMTKEDFVGFQWTTRRNRIPLLHVYSSSTKVTRDAVRWAFLANEVQFVEKVEEKAALLEKNRHVYFLEPMKIQENEEDELDGSRRENYEMRKEIRPYVNTSELLLALRAEQAILRIVFFPRGEKTPGALILVSTPKSMSIRLRSVLTIYFANTNVKTIGGLKMNTAEEKEKVLIDGYNLYYSVPHILDSSMVLPKPKGERAEKFADMPIDKLDFSVRTYNSLMRGNVRTLGDLVALTDEELLKIRNLGRMGVCEVREKLDDLECRGMLPLPKVKTKDAKKKKENPETDPLEALDRLIGLPEVKEQVRRIAAFARMQQDMKARHMEVVPVVLNMEFTGNPGTAKTTVARIMAKIFCKLGILSSSEIVEVGRADLVGEYVGQTAPKVKEIFSRARGKVLFIDEAYSLVDDYKSSYVDEAISTIVQEMENRREETIVIFAGYPDKMKEFMSKNPGLRSRVPFHLSFGDYSAEELGSITELEAGRRGFAISETAHAKVIEICGKAAGIGEYGNGRFCRNLVENAIVNFASRVYGMDGKPEEVRFELTASDITMPKNDVAEKKEIRRIGFLAD